MLNNQKSLLQRARIAMVAIVTIMSVGGAFAMNAPKAQALQTWGVLQTNANNYVVTAVTSGSFCEAATRICKVQSTATPDPTTHQIPKSGATTLENGAFQK